ncbi:syntaxin 2a isoform X2 [Denticeps clupeoides]|uniref:t-SNARE coiled-coil homology domain-containing protein n=1 Tax=Denticeps clupeoides TaxID=299321 RepID=A0AAY4A032_9TELE|nr:syntaxin-2-like isoform X2 [Denticeps clupeoides]
MKDRLAELNAYSSSQPADARGPEENPAMDDFLKRVAEVQVLVDKIASLVEEVKKRHCAILSAPNPEPKIKQELEQLCSEIRKHAISVQVRLKSMQTSQPEDENGNSTSVYHRIHRTQHSMLSQRFVEVMTAYNDAQISFREKSKGRIQRQLEITGHVLTDEDLENFLHSDSPSVFTSNILLNSQITRQALNEIESRHQDILRLETSIRELHEMFTDIAMLVETQGEVINSIEKNVTNATDYVGQAKVETKKAQRYQKRARRKYIIIGVIVLVLLLVLALVVGLSVGLRP